MTKLARQLGLFDATMIVMGGIIGSGIFINPYLVARQLHAPLLIIAAWALGGFVALSGGFIWAELAARHPELGGQYAYLREAFHPSVAFLYGWALLLVIQTGGMAAVAVTFARYFLELTGLPLADSVIAVLVLAILTLINCLGVRAGSSTQNLLMSLKIAAIGALVTCGFAFIPRPHAVITPVAEPLLSMDMVRACGAALTPIAFSYGGWQTASFMSAELRDPRRDLTRGLLLGVLGVVTLYLSVNLVYLRVLGPAGLAATTTPASSAMQSAIGPAGAAFTAAAIAISTLGFLSQGMLTAPRVYFAMAEDGLFFRAIAWVSPRTHAPAAAIALQGVLAVVIALSGRYEQILNYVISCDFIFFGLTAAALFVFRRRNREHTGYLVPGHPFTTALFTASCALIVAGTVYSYPKESLAGWLILASGIPAYLFWRKR
ncbi:MAG: amino acid permease [Bryobacterales bacterium]|nr:amino acid permease [Bryobacterales bacterium]